jgi:hypothetical protein
MVVCGTPEIVLEMRRYGQDILRCFQFFLNGKSDNRLGVPDISDTD